MEPRSVGRMVLMPSRFPPTPEERIASSFTEDSSTIERKRMAPVMQDSKLPTPNSPPRHSFTDQTDGPEHKIHDPIVVPLDDDAGGSSPLFADSHIDAIASTLEQESTTRPHTPSDSVNEQPSTPEPKSQVDATSHRTSSSSSSSSALSSIDAPPPFADNPSVSRSDSLFESSAQDVFKSPTVVVPGIPPPSPFLSLLSSCDPSIRLFFSIAIRSTHARILKSMEPRSVGRMVLMPSRFPPTPEERIASSFTEDSSTIERKRMAPVMQDSKLPTPNSPPRHSFTDQTDGPEHKIHDPIVVPLDDDAGGSSPLFADSHIDAIASTLEQESTTRPHTPSDSVNEQPSTPEPKSQVDATSHRTSSSSSSSSALSSIDAPPPFADNPSVSRSDSLFESSAQDVFKSPTVVVPGTTLVLPNTVDAVMTYYRDNLREIQALQRAQREAREPAASASADVYTRNQIEILNFRPTFPERKRKASALVMDEAISAEFAIKRQRPAATRVSPPPPKTRKPVATVTPKPKKASSTPKARASSTFSDSSPQTVKHQRSGPQKKALWPELKMEEWREADDYCPPISMTESIGLKVPPATSNGTNSKKTPAPWTDAEMVKTDISQLHPEEVVLAKDFRVEPQAYLMTKRRIFAARVRALVEHQNWNKTCAQQAVQMDVNKASRFFLAYDAVGWFDEKHFPEEVQNRWRENEKKRKLKL
nr:swirm domain-containing protein [Quercus suber]